MTRRVPITFMPGGVTAWVVPGVTVLEASRTAGVPITAPCGGRGVCGACGVRVLEGELAEKDPQEHAGLARAPKGVRLACRARVDGAVTVKPLVAGQRSATRGAIGRDAELVAGVDLGTTNVSAVIVDRAGGGEVGRSTVPNRQQSRGADVLTRVSAALDGRAPELASAAQASVLEALTAAAGDALPAVTRVVIAGNSAMSALLTGTDVTPLAAAPFTAPEPRPIPADSALAAGLTAGADIDVVLPLAAFVGGDIVAGLIALDVTSQRRPVLLVDIGTNAEVALWERDRLTVTSAAAGPAFEGAGIASGGPAVDGAVTSLRLKSDGEITLDTIGGVAPLCLSGAGLVSAVALLQGAGHLTEDGVLMAAGPLTSRFFRDEAGVLNVRLGAEGDSLSLSQLDVRAFQLAKAAVRVAIESVLRAADVRASGLERLWVAGAFGGALDPQQVVDVGLIPSGALSVIRAPGNTSLAGAAALALAPDEDAVATLRGGTSLVDLAGDPGFSGRLMEALTLSSYDV